MQRLAIALVSLGCSASWLACESRREPPVEQGPPGTPTEPVVRAPSVGIAQLDARAQRFEGQTVRVTGEVTRALGPDAVVIEGDGLIWRRAVVVVARAPLEVSGRTLRVGDHIEVRGVVRSPTAAGRVLGRPLSADVRAAAGADPVLVADRILTSEIGVRRLRPVRRRVDDLERIARACGSVRTPCDRPHGVPCGAAHPRAPEQDRWSSLRGGWSRHCT